MSGAGLTYRLHHKYRKYRLNFQNACSCTLIFSIFACKSLKHMDSSFYKTLVHAAPIGYAHHKIVLDKAGKPVDFTFLEVNKAFEELTGLKANDITGRKATEVLPGIMDDPFDWIGFYGEVALKGEPKTFQQYSAVLKRWYDVKTYSTKKGYFITAFLDITQARESMEQLKQYQERLSQAQAFTNTGLWEFDMQTGQLYWSKECEALFGLEEGEFTGSFEAFLERVYPDDRDYVSRINQPIVRQRSGQPLEYEHRIIRKCGEVRWVRETAGVSKDAEGKPEKITGFIVDITRQKKAEEAIEKEEKLRQIIDNFEGLFWLRAADTHKILYISPGYEEIFGKTAESLYEDPSSFLENILEEDKARVAKDYETFKRAGHFNTEYRMHSADGSIRWMTTRTFPVKNAQGETIRYAGIAADITERKLAEEAIQRSNQRLESLFEISKEVTSSTDQDALMQMIVNNAIKLAGLCTGAIYLKDQDENLRLSATAPALPDIFPDELRFASMKDHPHIEKALQTGEYVLMEDASSARLTSEEKKAVDLRNLRTNLFLPIMIRERAIGVLILSSVGETRTFTSGDLNLLRGFAFQAAHIIDNLNNYTGLKKHAQELERQIKQREKTEQELIIAKEKAEESDRLKSAFLATMNHELRTPLNHVIGFSDVIQSMAEDEDIRDFGASIYQSGNNLLSIIEDIFALAMAEQDKVRVKQEHFSVMELLNDAKSSLKGILNTAGKRDLVELSFQPELKILKSNAIGDRNKINQVLNNLFKNAVKFTEKGEIAFGFYREGEDHLTLYVKDTGVGVPEDKKEVIFEFFRQGDDSHTREHEGVGIGLAISSRILEAMDGRIWLESEEGKGSTFYFNIPLEVTDLEKTSKLPSVEVPDLSGNCLLLVEDDEDSMMLLRAMLKPTGAKILEATDGQEALEVLQNNPDTDMVLMDLRMPRMDGFEATRAIKAKQVNLPVVALTAYSLEADREKAEKAGSDQLLTKPVHKEMLYKLLEKYLGTK